MASFFMDKVGPSPKEPEKIESKTPIYRQEKEKSVKEMGIAERIATGETPIDVFEEENHQPYASELLNLDYSAAKEEMNLIDDYLKEEILFNEERPNLKTYTQHYKTLVKNLGLNGEVEPEAIVERVARFIRKFNFYKNSMERSLRKRIFKRMMKQAEMEVSEDLFKELDTEEQERYLRKHNLWE